MKKWKKLIVGNWKMNPLTIDEARNIGNTVKRSAKNLKKTQVVLCPPFVYIGALQSSPGGNVFLGSQDAYFEPMGHYTGEVSFSQLPQFNVKYVILGHSERRAGGETDTLINKKVRSVVTEGMTAILCVGEKARDNHGEYLNVVKAQLTLGLRDISKKSLDNLVIAYEPVWAIGAKTAMNPRDIHEMSIFIKKVLRDLFGTLADSVRVLYGGSVNVSDAEDIARESNVSGFLVGRESLKPKDFMEIVKMVDSI